jgi:hypothetical protein
MHVTSISFFNTKNTLSQIVTFITLFRLNNISSEYAHTTHFYSVSELKTSHLLTKML